MSDLSARRVALQARCHEQRRLLAQHVAAVRQRLETGDQVLGVARRVLGKSAAVAGGTALWWSARHTGWWGFMTRGAALLVSARKLYSLFKKR